MLMLCLSAPAWADVWTSYSSSTGEVKFDGSGIVTPDIVIQHKADVLKAKKVTFGTGITAIANHAFDGINGYTFEEVVIPKTLTTIESAAFLDCGSLKKFTVSMGENTLRIGQTPIDFWSKSAVAGGITLEFYRPFEVAGAAQKPLFPSTNYITYVRLIANQYWSKVPDQVFKGCQALTTVELGRNSYGSWVEIGAEAFMGCISLNTITIPNTVTKFGDYAFAQTLIKSVDLNANATVGTGVFSNCAALATVKTSGVTGALPAGWTSISESLFARCSKLTAITLPDNVTSIGASAFSGTGLTTINLANVTSIGDYAFSGSKLSGTYDLSNVSDEKLGKYAFRNTNITEVTLDNYLYNIPEGLFEGTKLTTIAISPNLRGTIGANAFKNCTELVSVTAPGVRCNATSIGNSAFEGCSKLTTFAPVLTSALTSIGDNAFKGTGITAIQFLDTYISQALTIGESAFEGSKLTSITLPARLSELGNYAFRYCDDLERVELQGDSQAGELTIGDHAFRKTGSVTKTYNLVCDRDFNSNSVFQDDHCLGSVTFGNHVTKIPNYTFNRSHITEVTLPASLQTIGEKAFNKSKLKSISLPSSVTTVGMYAFAECDDLESITFQSGTSVMAIGEHAFTKSSDATQTFTFTCNRPFTYATTTSWSTTGDRGLFFTDKNVVSVTIGANATTIPAYTFYICSSLTTVDMENAKDLNSVETYAFGQCSSLASVKLPTNLSTIGNHAFEGCSALISLDDATVLQTIGEKAFYKSKLKSISLPSNVTTVGKYAFAECDDLESITFQSGTSVMAIGAHAFDKSSDATKTFTFNCARPFTYERASSVSTETYVGDYGLFYKNPLLTAVTFGNNITSIPLTIFYYCTSLTTVDMENAKDLNSIEAFAFGLCSNLASVKLPANLTTIGDGAFEGCSALTSISLGDVTALKTIGENAFKKTNLQEDVNIPESVTNIRSGAFGDIANQLDVYVDNTPEGITIAEDAFSSLANIYYRGEMPYNQWIASFTEDERLAMTELTITNNSIANHEYTADENLFTLFPNVTDLTFGENVTMVGKNIFSGQAASYIYEPTVTPKLQHVTFKNNPEIGAYAFRYCTELASVTGTVKSVSNGSFFMCSALTSITITEDNVIEKGAFLKCKALTTVNLPQNLTEIAGQSFLDCASLKNIEIPSSVTTIGLQAFFECRSLESIELPSGVEAIGINAFAADEKLSKVICHNATPIEIDSNVFSGIASGAILYVPSEGLAAYNANASWKNSFASILEIPSGDVENIHWSYEDGVLAFTGKGEMPASTAWNKYASTATSIVFGSGITKIKENTFQNLSALQSVTIPYSMGEIGTGAFKNSTLKEVNLALPAYGNSNASEAIYHFSKVTNVGALTTGKGALLLSIDGRQLTESDEITYPEFSKNPNPDAVRYFSNIYNLRITCYQQDIPASYFANWKYLKNVIIEGNNYVEEIGMNAFSSSGIEGIRLPSCITKIDNDAFFNCTHLKNVEMYDGVEIGNEAFMDCNIENLKITFRQDGNAITFTNIASDSHQPFYGAFIKSINLCHDITDAAFKDGYALQRWCELANLDYLTSARNADGIKLLLNDVEWDETKMFTLPIYLRHTNGALASFSNVKRLQLANALTGQYEINASEYADHSFLKEVEIPECISKINSNAFSYSGLEKVVILGSPVIATDAFNNTTLKDLSLRNASVAGTHFKGMSTLEHITLYTGTIPSTAFNNCSSLSMVSISPNVVVASETTPFFNCPKFAAVDVLSYMTTSAEDIFSKPVWRKLVECNLNTKNLFIDGKEPKVLTFDMNTIPANTLYRVGNVKNVVLTENVKFIGGKALYSYDIEHITCFGNLPTELYISQEAQCLYPDRVTLHIEPETQWGTSSTVWGKFNVMYNAAPVTLNMCEANINDESPIQLYAVNTTTPITWSTNGSDIVSVDETGLVTLNKNFVYNGTSDRIGKVIATAGIGETGEFTVEFTPTSVDLTDGQPFFNSKAVDVESIVYTRKFGTTMKWQPLYIPFSMRFEDWNDQDLDVARINVYYEYDEDGDGIIDHHVLQVVKVTEANGALRPNHPYLVRARVAGTKQIDIANATLYEANENSVECSTMETRYIFNGTYRPVNGMKTNGYYFLSGGEMKTADNDELTLSPYRWYLRRVSRDGQFLVDDANAPARISIHVVGEDIDETLIEVVDADAFNETTYIYNLKGQKVSDGDMSSLPAGVYIRNDKKIYIR